MTSRAWAGKELLASGKVLLFCRDSIVLNGKSWFWSVSRAEKLLAGTAEPVALGEGCFAVELDHDGGCETRSLRSLLFSEAEGDLAMLSRANQLLYWRRSHRFCGHCGAPTRPGETERALDCPSCGQQFFPRINPCVIMLVTRGDEVLLARSARYRSGFYSCLAGFMEIGETPEQTIIREVREEVGVEIHNIRYVESQPWPFPSQLMLGFHADYHSGEIVPEPGEIEDARWFHIHALPKTPPPTITIAGKLIQAYTLSRSPSPSPSL